MKSRKTQAQVNAGSMADIAFLLLIFFLVTTVIQSDKGLMLKLPAKQENPIDVEIPSRNLFTILINSDDELMVEGEVLQNITNLRKDAKAFILNPGKDPNLSESPEKAIISIKTSRGTAYKRYLKILDEMQATYYGIYAERAGISVDAFRKLDQRNPKERSMYLAAREGIPMNISIANPTK